MNLTLLLVVVAATVTFLVWALVDLATRLLQAWRERFTRETDFHLRELFLFVDPARLYALNLALTLLGAGTVWLLTGSVVVALALAIALALSPSLVFRWLRVRRIEQLERQLPDALQMLAGTARAGLSLPAAIRQVSTELTPPLQQELLLVQHEQRLGVALDDALENLARRIPAQPVKLMVSAMRIANETGGSLAETLERTAGTLRSQHAMELKIRALTAQGKLQAWVVGLLPVFLLWVLARMEPEAMSLLWTTQLGWGVLGAVIVMELIGVLLIRRIVAIDI
ncbi:MAG TPA: pilus assembly protein [Thauera sp.]|nr:pilus assembly protein [Thauera sp.]